jgi:hypothetical protein
MSVTIGQLVDNRLLSSKAMLISLSANIIKDTTEEIMACNGFEGKKDADLSTLQKSYLADLVAAALLKYSLDRFKEDAKATLGSDGLVHEAQNKLAYLQEMITGFETDASVKAGSLGLNMVSGAPVVIKVGANNQSRCGS